MKRILKQILCLSFFIVFITSTSNVFARGVINTNNKATLNIYHSYGNKPLSDVKFSIYHIADITEQVKFKVNDTFKKYPIDFNDIYDSTEWYVLADTLANYIKTDSIPATNTLVTNSEGKATLSNLKVGLYLGIAETVSIDNKTIQTKPFLVSLPNIDEKDNIWTYNITVNTKTDSDIEEYVDISVEKIWENKEEDLVAPISITVGLYRDGKPYDTAVLSKNNNWKYTWSNLSKDFEWTVKEIQVPPNYTVSYEVYGSTITITNTYQGEEIGGEDDGDDDEDGKYEENKPGDADNKPEDEDKLEDSQSKLPVTGEMLSISSIIALSILLIFVGYIFIKE